MKKVYPRVCRGNQIYIYCRCCPDTNGQSRAKSILFGISVRVLLKGHFLYFGRVLSVIIKHRLNTRVKSAH